MSIPTFPDFTAITLSMKDDLSTFSLATDDGLSDYLFCNLYFFRDYYKYLISKADFGFVIRGNFEDKDFFMIPSGKLSKEWLKKALKDFGTLNIVAPSLISQNEELFHSDEFQLIEDRANFDYLYLREDLAKLPGKKFHKKKNHVNKFKKSYRNISVKALTNKNSNDALAVLDIWRKNSGEDGDYDAAKECLKHIESAELSGILLYVDKVPVAWTVAEIYDHGKLAVVYFEKADINYEGSFQYVNYALANFLPESIIYINREQDLGKPGLIKAKQTYNPIGFVKKYSLTLKS